MRAAAWLSVIALSAATIYFGPGTRSPTIVAPINALAVRLATGPAASDEYRYERLANPARTVVRNGTGTVLATFTDGAQTALLTGPVRVFPASRAIPQVAGSTAWVRLLPQPWAEGAELATWFRSWLDTALADRSPDALAIALEYVAGNGRKISGSRFAQLVYGAPGSAATTANSEPGPMVPVISNKTREYNLLQPGDLLFFDLDAKGGRPIDCVGIYFGMDSGGHHRVLFSRSAPALGDGGRFSQGFRFAKRI